MVSIQLFRLGLGSADSAVATLVLDAQQAPTAQGFRRTFDIKVASRNTGASMYNNIPFGFFYKDKETGK